MWVFNWDTAGNSRLWWVNSEDTIICGTKQKIIANTCLYKLVLIMINNV